MGDPVLPPSFPFPCFRFLVVTMAMACMTMSAIGLPIGAPKYVCGTMKPLHPGREQSYSPNTFPYVIDIKGGKQVSPGSDVMVTIQSKKRGEVFQGFLVTVVDMSGQSLSGLTASPTDPLRLLNCTRSGTGVPASGLTHTQRLARDSVTFGWHVPDTAVVGDIYNIRLTMVQDVWTYWVGINTTLTIIPIPETTSLHTGTTSLHAGTTSSRPTRPGGAPSGSSSSSSSGSLPWQARPWRLPAEEVFGSLSHSNLVSGSRRFSGHPRTNTVWHGSRGRGREREGSVSNSGMAAWLMGWFGR